MIAIVSKYKQEAEKFLQFHKLPLSHSSYRMVHSVKDADGRRFQHFIMPGVYIPERCHNIIDVLRINSSELISEDRFLELVRSDMRVEAKRGLIECLSEMVDLTNPLVVTDSAKLMRARIRAHDLLTTIKTHHLQ